MTRYLAFVIAATVTLSACSRGGVPKVGDPHHVSVNGVAMTQLAFITKYCVEKPSDETCVIVKRAMLEDSVYGNVPRF